MMNKLLTILILMLLAWSTPVLCNDKAATMTWYKLVKIFSLPHAEKVPDLIKNEPLTQLHAKGNILSFRWRGIAMRFEFVGRERAVFRFNGRNFSFKDLSSEESLSRAIRSKFGLAPGQSRQVEKFDDEEGRLNASIDAVGVNPLRDDSADYQEIRVGVTLDSTAPATAVDERHEGNFGAHFEKLFNKGKKRVYDLFPDSTSATSKNDDLLMLAMQRRFDILSGPYQKAMLVVLGNWFGGLNAALGIAALPGESPMDAFMGYNQFNPSSIKMPRK